MVFLMFTSIEPAWFSLETNATYISQNDFEDVKCTLY